MQWKKRNWTQATKLMCVCVYARLFFHSSPSSYLYHTRRFIDNISSNYVNEFRKSVYMNIEYGIVKTFLSNSSIGWVQFLPFELSISLSLCIKFTNNHDHTQNSNLIHIQCWTAYSAKGMKMKMRCGRLYLWYIWTHDSIFIKWNGIEHTIFI